MTYKVKYRIPGQWFWTRLNNVTGDGVEIEAGFMWFILQDESAVRIPLTSEVKFSPERVTSVLKAMSSEAGQQVVKRDI